jgi:hypothetical protein
MLNLKIEEFPEFLKKSQLFETLSQDNAETIPIPEKYFLDHIDNKFNLQTFEKLHHKLNVLRYWGVHELPHELYESINHVMDEFKNYVHSQAVNRIIIKLSDKLNEFNDFRLVDELKCLVNNHRKNKKLMIIATNHNYIGLLKFGFQKDKFTPKTCKRICQIAIKADNFECLQLLHENNCKLNKWTVASAAENPNIKYLKYLLMNATFWNRPDNDFGKKWYKELYLIAAKNGYLEHMKFLWKTNCYSENDIASRCASSGNAECLDFILSTKGLWTNTGSHVYQVQNIDCYNILIKHKLIDNTHAYEEACSYRNVELLKYIYQNSNENIPVKCYELVIYGIHYYDYDSQTEHNIFEIVKYLHENNCDWNIDTHGTLYNIASRLNDENMLQYLVENEYPIITNVNSNSFMSNAACHKDLKILKWGFDNKYQIGLFAYRNAIRNDNIKALEYLFEHDKENKWNNSVTKYAAELQRFDCLKFAIENGCEFTSTTLIFCAMNGRLDMLKYCYTKCCDKLGKYKIWSTYDPVYLNEQSNYGGSTVMSYSMSKYYSYKCWGTACYYAAKNGYLDTLKFCFENGCKLGNKNDILRICCKYDRVSCLKYICNNMSEDYIPNQLCYETAVKHNSVKCLQHMILKYSDKIFPSIKTKKEEISYSQKKQNEFDDNLDNMLMTQIKKMVLKNTTIGGKPVKFDDNGEIIFDKKINKIIPSVPQEIKQPVSWIHQNKHVSVDISIYTCIIMMVYILISILLLQT